MAPPTIFDREQRIVEHFVRPGLAAGSILVTALEWPDQEIILRPFTTALFAVVAVLSLATLVSWPRRTELALWILYAVTAAVLLPLAQATAAPIFAFLAAAGAGGRLGSRRAAVLIAILTSVTATIAVTVVHLTWPDTAQFTWLEALATGLPSYIGIARTDRAAALANAKRAASEALRAADSEAREATLLERGRIARELHDVLGHSLTGIALQLDLADALNENNRRDEATRAMRNARKLAVDSIADMRGAVHALSEDTVSLTRTLHTIAENAGATFAVVGEERVVSVETAHALHRAAQEALTNAAKHAPGSAAQVELIFTPGSVALTVANGRSETPVPVGIGGGTGLGLAAMRERVAALGGTVEAGPAGDGWAVRLSVGG